MPVGQFAGQVKYWPWFWLIVPVYVLVTPLSVLIALVFDHKSLDADIKAFRQRLHSKKQHAA